MRLKSTLPSLFQTSKSLKQNNSIQANRVVQDNHIQNNTKSPHRQGGIYNLNLTISFNARSGHYTNIREYGTKIISFKKNENKQRSKSLFISHQLSPNKKQAKQKVEREHSLDRYNHLRNNFVHNRTESLSFRYKNNKQAVMQENIGTYQMTSQYITKLEQIDNLRVNYKKLQQQTYLLQKQIEPLHHQRQDLAIMMRQSGERMRQQVQEMEQQMSRKIGDLYEMLSNLRKQTRMEQKVIKYNMQVIDEDLKDVAQVSKGIQEHRSKIHSINF